MDAQVIGGGNADLGIVEKDHLRWPHTHALTGHLVDATIGLGDAHLW